MTARVLIVDDIPANIRYLEARLAAEYFDVLTAMSGQEALDMLEKVSCDIILLDVMMPGMDGFETCRRIKANPATHHIPVVIVTALDQPSDRIAGLEAGADDFLTKPIDDLAVLTRVRSLVRLKTVQDELRLRNMAGAEGLPQDMIIESMSETGLHGQVLLVDDHASSSERIVEFLAGQQHVTVQANPQAALLSLGQKPFDLVIISMNLLNVDALRLCSQIRSMESTRSLPILLLSDPEESNRLMRGLDLGVNDYVVRPIDRNELAARARTQIRKWRYMARLRNSLQQLVEQAVIDGLTGLHNRRFMEKQLLALSETAIDRIKPLSVLLLDIDHFKTVNDRFGHGAGDDVLREFSDRVRANIRTMDFACRLGGEEFVVIMPETEAAEAAVVAERIRAKVAGDPFHVQGGAVSITVTVSIGLAARLAENEDAETLIKRADRAVYQAKHDGRNRVVQNAA